MTWYPTVKRLTEEKSDMQREIDHFEKVAEQSDETILMLRKEKSELNI